MIYLHLSAMKDRKPHFIGDRAVYVRYKDPEEAGAAYADAIQAAQKRWGITSLRGLDTYHTKAVPHSLPLGERSYIALKWRA